MITLIIGRGIRLIRSLAQTALLLIVAGCASTGTAQDAASVIKAFNAAMNSKDVEAAMALIADDAVFNVPAPIAGTYTGKAQIRTWVQSIVNANNQSEQSNLQASQDKATWNSRVTQNGSIVAFRTAEAVVQDGKIKSFILR